MASRCCSSSRTSANLSRSPTAPTCWRTAPCASRARLPSCWQATSCAAPTWACEGYMNAPTTIAQKLVARAAGRRHVTPGEVVTCRVDLAMFHDSSGPRRLKPLLEELGASIWDKGKVVLVIDHYVPEADDE